ncbi:FdhF/YdeP family oxidoreductase [Xanthovirga aplysinae]|uniref:FdhF/YdeP family oxidoreductase n=1 Tax=Xanthovirga aplysinae TaxID=2529853 RepID=UPI0012BB54E4|nr:FdhF/YdeP family oxidoreductase [Xanthovirga aplysinae]MTI30880.1 FdhF/YdeP family oxidoreductase [Xanthovirga aplysinae]
MKEDFRRKVSARGPEDFLDIKVKEPVRHAAGMLGVKVALQHSFKEMGVLRSMRALLEMNQKEGFDCPSCAWPAPDKPSKIAEYCENGAKALADEATTNHIGREFFKQYSVEQLLQLSDYQLNQFGRITEPLVLREGSIHYEPVKWEEAYQMISEVLQKLDSPDEAIFYTSGRSSNEAAFLYGMFARAIGTNNMPDCSNMCHESSGVALKDTLGIGKGSAKLEDIHEAEVVIVAGQNPGTNHPRMLAALEKCKKNGGKVISINPLEEAGLVNFKNPHRIKGILGKGEDLTDIHLPVRINQDMAVVKLLIKKLATLDKKSGGVFDHEFIAKYTDGYKALMEDIQKHDEKELLQLCGISEKKIDQTVQLLANSSKIVVCWAMGLTQHKNGVENIREFVNLLLLKGAIGKAGAGTCPVRGHSNVQGDRSVGIMHYVDEPFNERIEKHLGFKPPVKEGLDVVGAIRAMHEGEAKFFMCLGGNFLMAAADTDYTADAIQNCTLTVQISTKLNRTHLVTGKTALILPTFGRSEKDMKNGKQRYLTVENSMGRVRQSRGLLKPISDAIKSEPEIIGELADHHFKGQHPMNWKAMGSDYELIRKSIDKVVKGFSKTSERSKGAGYYLPNNVRELDFSKLPNGKAQITLNKLPVHQLEEDEFLLMTLRSHDQFNTTIYGLDDRYRGIYNERRVLFMNPKDMEKHELSRLDVVDISSEYDGIKRTAYKFRVIPYKIPVGNLGAYYPETNVVVPYNHYADRSHTPISKSVKVRIVKSART